MTDLRDKIVGVLNIEGAFCGTCDREPGDSLYCKACVRVLNGSADAVLAVLDLDKVRAVAWDEDYWLGINGYTGPGNPYRAGLYRKEEQ